MLDGPALVLVLDAVGRIVDLSEGCSRSIGYARAELIGQPVWQDLLPPEEAAGLRAALQALSNGTGALSLGAHLLTRECRRIPADWV
ncbi:MAG TPA: PAS domain-containing protein, partial [Longimicrobiales bacterium]|nr:PAS domain-containing protein [Longimicrobiales bacterium]